MTAREGASGGTKDSGGSRLSCPLTAAYEAILLGLDGLSTRSCRTFIERAVQILDSVRCEVTAEARVQHRVANVVQMHYSGAMKTAVIPQVRVEPELRADLDSVLLPGETLTEFVEASVRRAVEYRRVQTDFAARCGISLAAYERTGVSIPADVVLSKLEAKVAARVKQLRK